MNKLSAREIIDILGEMWGSNNYDGYVSLFTGDALVTHPYFTQPVKVSVAMEVINAAVQGNTKIIGYEPVSGDGTGKDDVVKVKFQETGDQIVEEVDHVGAMIVFVFIKNHKIYKMEVKGVEISSVKPTCEAKNYRRIEYGDLTAREIAEKLGASWECNHIEEFISLFSENAKIKHVVLDEESTPEVIAEVMNCNVKGTTKLTDYALLNGNGTGKDDVIELTFDETGTEMGYEPSNIGKIMVSVTIKNHRIVYLNVYGYKVSNNI